MYKTFFQLHLTRSVSQTSAFLFTLHSRCLFKHSVWFRTVQSGQISFISWSFRNNSTVDSSFRFTRPFFIKSNHNFVFTHEYGKSHQSHQTNPLQSTAHSYNQSESEWSEAQTLFFTNSGRWIEIACLEIAYFEWMDRCVCVQWQSNADERIK